MNLLDLYKSILSTASLTADKDGMISLNLSSSTMPFTVKGKRMVLPTVEHLNNPDKSNIVIFHPLSENLLEDESPVMEKFRAATNTKLNYTLGCLIEELLTLCTSVGEHSKMSPDQSELLSFAKDADEKTLINFKGILKNMGLGDKSKCIVHIFLKRGGKVSKRVFDRAAIVTFPLYEELLKKEKTVYGVTLRAKDRESILNILKFVITQIDVPHAYDKGSESDIGPFLDVLMRTVMSIASRINAIVADYRKFLNNPEDFEYASDWVGVFDNLSQMLPQIRAIPMQVGNHGTQQSVATQPTQQFAVAPAVQQPTMIGQPQVGYPQQQQVPAGPPMTANGGIDFHALMQRQGMGQQVFGMPQMLQGPAALRAGTPVWAQPQFGVQPGMFQQQQQFQQQPQQGFSIQQQGPYGSI